MNSPDAPQSAPSDPARGSRDLPSWYGNFVDPLSPPFRGWNLFSWLVSPVNIVVGLLMGIGGLSLFTGVPPERTGGLVIGLIGLLVLVAGAWMLACQIHNLLRVRREQDEHSAVRRF